MNLSRLRDKILNQIYPSEEEIREMKKNYNEISEFIESEYKIKTHFAGSASRGTGMRGDNDIDIFLLFSENLGENELENKGLKIGEEVFERFNGDYKVDYAEHPYTKGEINDYEVEIVPCYDTSPKNIKSSVDRTPHHSRWVEKNLDPQQRKDVVLLKKFLDTEGIYGSSLKKQGFSGYLCEILVSEYGSFNKLIESANNWSEKEIVDPENHHEKGLPDRIESKFKNDNLIVIDPVDPERNVASVLTSRNYSRFIYLCWRFKNSPGMEYFQQEEQKYTEFEIKQEIDKRKDFTVIEFEKPEAVEDIIYPQLRKTLKRIEDELKKNDFRIFDSGFHVGQKTRIFFEIERTLPEIEYVKGPKPFHGEDHIKQFNSKYSNVTIREDRLYAKTSREYTDGRKLIKNFLENNLQEKGIPKYVAEKIREYKFSEPVLKDEKWLNYLGQKLDIDKNR